jgi:hypothetical protein
MLHYGPHYIVSLPRHYMLHYIDHCWIGHCRRSAHCGPHYIVMWLSR